MSTATQRATQPAPQPASRSGSTSGDEAVEQTVYLNGEFTPISEARVPVLDRGFIFGDGIYEVAPSYEGKLFRWPQHLARLKRSVDKIRIPNPKSDAEWTSLIRDLVARHPWPNQFVYLQITRGVARRDHLFPKDLTPTVFAMSSEFRLPSAQIVGEGIRAITLPDERWLHCDIKSTSLLGNCLARTRAADSGAMECLMFRDGRLTEGSSSNVWALIGGVLVGAPKDNLILEGIRYGLIEELARQEGIPFEVRTLNRAQVAQATELMVSSATKEILPVTTLDGMRVGDGKPGPVFKRLHEAYRKAVENWRDAPQI